MSTRIIFIRSLLLVSGITVSTISSVQAQESSDALIAKGKELYFEQVSCWVCHGDEAEGRIGPTIAYGPTPAHDDEGNSMVVRDQGGFHNGINPAEGSPLLD